MANWIEDPGEDSWNNNLSFHDLNVDEAYLTIKLENNGPVWLYTQSPDCVLCPFYQKTIVNVGETVLKYSTKRTEKMRIFPEDREFLSAGNFSGDLCQSFSPSMGEFGVYNLDVKNNENITDGFPMSCDFTTSKEPVNIYLPLLAIILGLLIFAIVSTLATYCVKKLIVWHRDRDTSTKPGCEMSDYGADDRTTQVSAKPARHRVRSLDTFRGLSIVIMIFVNDGAGHYWFLEHATWNGLQFADFVFPWFMWIMGVCIPIGIKSQLKRGVSRWRIILNIIRRSIILFGLGLMVGGGTDLDTIRIPGVLQRFGVVYFVVATIAACFTSRSSSSSNRFPGSKLSEMFLDITVVLPQWIVILSILAAYCYFEFFFPVPGCPPGYLGPGGIQDEGEFRHCTGGMTGYVDKLLLGEKHIYSNPTIKTVYKTGPFDPEGVLGIMTSIFQVFLGVQAGSIIVHHVTWKGRIVRWLCWGTFCAIGALILALPNIIPINKNLWSISFVFATSFAAFYLLSIIYLLQDHLRLWNGVPFKAPGMNSTILYVGHSIAYDLFPFHWSYGPMNTHFILTLESIWGTALWVLIAYWLYYVDFFLTI